MKNILILLFIFSFTYAEDANVQEFTNATNTFTLTAYKQVAKLKDGNFLVSPFSAETVLALAQSGSKGETAQEIRDALHLPDDKQKVESVIKTLLPKLKSSSLYTLLTANKIYVLNDFPIKDEFKKAATEIYQAESEGIDFSKTAEAAETINDWTEKHTNNKVKDLINSDDLDDQTKAVLINALYFKANWSNPFSSILTFKKKFYKTATDAIEVNTLHHYAKSFKYSGCPHLKANFLELPFKGEEASLVIVLPYEKDGLATIENQIDYLLSAPLHHQWQEGLVNVALPKFRIETAIDFKVVLKKLGVNKIFDIKEADLSGIAGSKGELIVDKVEQKTFIDVNEEGVEAAVPTNLIVAERLTGPIGTPYNFIADHPFLFYIKVKDLVIFIGRVTDPLKS